MKKIKNKDTICEDDKSLLYTSCESGVPYIRRIRKKGTKDSVSLKEKRKAKIIFAFSIVFLAAVLVIIGVVTKKGLENPYKNEYITTEEDILMPTAQEGATELITDDFGNEMIVREDGVYKKSDFGDSYEKMMNLKVVPLVGKWASDTTGTTYEFFEDGTFQIAVPYDNGDGVIQKVFYKGDVVIHPDYRTAFPQFGCGNIAEFLKKISVDEKTFLSKNLYYVSLHYSTITDTESNTVHTVSETEFETMPDEPDAAFDGVLYTYWLEDIDTYQMKVCSQITGEITTFKREG